MHSCHPTSQATKCMRNVNPALTAISSMGQNTVSHAHFAAIQFAKLIAKEPPAVVADSGSSLTTLFSALRLLKMDSQPCSHHIVSLRTVTMQEPPVRNMQSGCALAPVTVPDWNWLQPADLDNVCMPRRRLLCICTPVITIEENRVSMALALFCILTHSLNPIL